MNAKKTLCVDLDNTLIKTDMILENLHYLFKNNPQKIFHVFRALINGKLAFKNALTQHTEFEPASLPYREEVLKYIEATRKDYKEVFLVTGSPLSTAKKIANYLSVFDGVIGSEDINLTGNAKATHLEGKFGIKGFDYIGDSHVDHAVWEKSDLAIVVCLKKIDSNPNVHYIETNKHYLKSFIKLIRPQQWGKNLLIFLPLLLGHQISNKEALLQALIGTLAFSFIASTVYVLNDLMDVTNDRLHHLKKYRPLAAGDFSLFQGLIIAAVMFVLATILSIMVGNGSEFLLTYLILNLVYSTFAKKIVMIDILLLTAFYLIRILYGGNITNIEVSFWLLGFSFFIFTSLAFSKRYSELLSQFKKSGTISSSGRGYNLADLPIIQSLGIGTGLISTLLLGLYFHIGENVYLYSKPKFLWAIEIVILYWISRLWFLTTRGHMHDDPVKFAFMDLVSIACGFICIFLGFLAKGTL